MTADNEILIAVCADCGAQCWGEDKEALAGVMFLHRQDCPERVS